MEELEPYLWGMLLREHLLRVPWLLAQRYPRSRVNGQGCPLGTYSVQDNSLCRGWHMPVRCRAAVPWKCRTKFLSLGVRNSPLSSEALSWTRFENRGRWLPAQCVEQLRPRMHIQESCGGCLDYLTPCQGFLLVYWSENSLSLTLEALGWGFMFLVFIPARRVDALHCCVAPLVALQRSRATDSIVSAFSPNVVLLMAKLLSFSPSWFCLLLQIVPIKQESPQLPFITLMSLFLRPCPKRKDLQKKGMWALPDTVEFRLQCKQSPWDSAVLLGQKSLTTDVRPH